MHGTCETCIVVWLDRCLRFLMCTVQVSMRALGFEVKKVDVLRILQEYDRDAGQKINKRDFVEVGELVQLIAHALTADIPTSDG